MVIETFVEPWGTGDFMVISSSSRYSHSPLGCGVFSLNPGEHYRGKGAPSTSFKRSPQEFPLMIKNKDGQILNLAISFSLADNI
jgi:hypothetical protein